MTTAIITGLVTIVVALIGYLGLKDQNRTAKAGSDTSSHTAATDSALKAWEQLLEPYRAEVQTLRTEVGDLRRQQNALTDELHRWQSVAKTLARWGITMRDQLRGLGHEVPAEPDELVALRIVSDVNDDNVI